MLKIECICALQDFSIYSRPTSVKGFTSVKGVSSVKGVTSVPLMLGSICLSASCLNLPPCQVSHLVKRVLVKCVMSKSATWLSVSPCHVRHPVKVLSIQQFISSTSYSVLSVYLQQVIIYFNVHTVFCFVTIPTVYFGCVY